MRTRIWPYTQISDDIFTAGLLLAYLCFLPFAEPGSIDGPSLQVQSLSAPGDDIT